MKTAISILVILLFIMTKVAFSQITINFTVDAAATTVGPGGMHIAGQFLTDSSITITEDWDPGAQGSQMTLLSGTTWQVQVSFPFNSAGKLLEFEFVRDSAWFNSSYGDVSEGNPGDCCLDETCGVLDGSGGINRVLTIPNCSGEYNCSWNNCAFLIASSSLAITVTPQNVLICKGESVQLTATSLATILWLPDPTLSCLACSNPIASPDITTSYFVTASIGNCIVTDTVLVTVSVPELAISNDTVFCEGQSLQLSAGGTGIISWSPTEGLSCSLCDAPVASPLSTTLYFVTSTVGDCSITDSLLITVDTLSITAGSDQNIFYGESVQLNATGSSDYLWSPTEGLSCTDCPSPIASPLATISYEVTSTSVNGCKSSDAVTIFVTVPCVGIFFPNAFTPNGDGRNDTFGPVSELNPPIKAFRIFNRWGQLVFLSTAFSVQWDGTFENQLQPIESYIYNLELDCEGNGVLMKGVVMLVR
ncbi:MAG: gliding motility-associated C-terminal domain-containing protein [Chitinophagales bacterium]